MFQRPMLVQMLSCFRGNKFLDTDVPRSAASPEIPISTLSRLRPIADVNTELKLLFKSRMRDNFPRLRFPSVPGRPMGFQGNGPRIRVPRNELP